MALFEAPEFDLHEHVSFFADAATGLRAIIAIHRTGAVGTAGGGCRIWPYATEAAAERDALRLSRAMTYKLALLELPAGGAKMVVIGDATRDKNEALLLAIGRAVDRLGGRFIVATDVGTNSADLQTIARSTMWVSREDGNSDGAWGTAYGVLVGLRAAVRRRLGRDELSGLKVAVQGLGRVGAALCSLLAEAGARLWVTDLDANARAAAQRQWDATPVRPDAIVDQEVDVFAPCALADAIDTATIPRLRCRVIAGSANNQLADPRLADELVRRDILLAPDIVINSGGAIAAASSLGSRDARAALQARLDTIGALVDAIFTRAERERVSPLVAAERTARERFLALGGRP
jgi:leucine dehydrogenase